MATIEIAPRAETVKESVQRIALVDTYPSPTNPRTYMDPEEIQKLADNIHFTGGLIEPIVLRKKEKQYGGLMRPYEIVAGQRRYEAHMALLARGLREFNAIDAIVRNMTDLEVLEQQGSENLHREDLQPLDWAEYFRQRVDAEKKKQGSGEGAEKSAVAIVASKFGKSTSVVYQTIQLAKLIEPAKELLRKGKISKNHAIDCARLSVAHQKGYLRECFRYGSEADSVRAMREWIDEDIHHKISAARFPIDEAGLYPPAGACTTCPKLSSNNPDLFTDADAKNAVCTDGTCYDRKTKAFDVGVERLAKKAQNVAVSGATVKTYINQAEPIVATYGSPESAKKVAAAVREQIVVRTPATSADAPKRRTGPSPESKHRKARELETKARRKIVLQILAGANKAARKESVLLVNDDLRTVALSFFTNLPNDFQVALGKAFGWERTSGKGQYETANMTRTAEAKVPKMSRAQLAIFMLGCSVADDLQIASYAETASQMRDMGTLGELAKRYKVNVDKIREDVKKANEK